MREASHSCVVGLGAARKRAKLVETASVRAMSEAPSENNSMDFGMSQGGADDMSDGELPSWRGQQSTEPPHTPAADEPVPTVEVCSHHILLCSTCST